MVDKAWKNSIHFWINNSILWLLSKVVTVLSQISAELVKVENACKCSLKATAFCVLAVAAASFGGVASVGGGFRGNQNKELKSFISTSQDFLASAALKPCSKGFKPFELIESNKVTIATCENLCSIESRDLPLIIRTIFTPFDWDTKISICPPPLT